MKNFNRFLVLLVSMWMAVPAFADNMTALEAVEKMYRDYFKFYEGHSSDVPKMKFSKAFSDAIKENDEICSLYAYGICGWASERSEYLDTQDAEPSLTFIGSGITFQDLGEDLIAVRLNVFPSNKKCGSYCEKLIKFKMVSEGDIWVIDDVYYTDDISSRKRLSDENEYNKKYPDPNSQFAKENGKQ